MPNPQLIGPHPESAPATLAAARARKREIPKDLLLEASHRLGVMCLLAGVLWIVATVLWHVTWPAFHPGKGIPGLSAPDWIALASGVASLGLWLFIRRSGRPPQFYLDLGLGYMVITCLAIGLVMHWSRPMYALLEPEVSWIAVVLLMFAAALPVDPRNMAIAAFVGASMGPATMALTHVHGLSTVDALKSGLLMHYSDYLVAGVAVVISRVVTRLGRQVSKAREMGSYQLGDLIKRGGMGEIYKATHRMLARPAAIKLIRREMLTTDEAESAELAIKRFHREAEAAANLRCPHTVELFDFGITEDKTLYFVMELLVGMDLETLVRNHGPMPASRVIHIMRQVCDSLEEAHSQGLVHRDIKPANIHLGKVGVRHDFVKVLDFGLVKSVKKHDVGDSLATSVGLIPGTPSYMPPEMALGETIDGRADIYSAGCVAYFLLTGKLVFEAESPLQMVAKHFRSEPVPPSQRAGIDLPPGLDEIILACLAKRPEQRPATAASLSQSLAQVRTAAWSEHQAEEWWSGVPTNRPDSSPRQDVLLATSVT
jgi:serine/threonine protein kinase